MGGCVNNDIVMQKHMMRRECENHKIFVGPTDRHVQYSVGPADFLSVRNNTNVK